ncbi:hypothetical protein RYX36_030393 [Vicia faba]
MLLHVTDNYLVDPVKIYGPNMHPIIDLNPSIFLAERITPRSGKIAHRDFVVFRPPQNPRRTATKRVVGLEGDSITYVSNLENSNSVKDKNLSSNLSVQTLPQPSIPLNLYRKSPIFFRLLQTTQHHFPQPSSAASALIDPIT